MAQVILIATMPILFDFEDLGPKRQRYDSHGAHVREAHPDSQRDGRDQVGTLDDRRQTQIVRRAEHDPTLNAATL